MIPAYYLLEEDDCIEEADEVRLFTNRHPLWNFIDASWVGRRAGEYFEKTHEACQIRRNPENMHNSSAEVQPEEIIPTKKSAYELKAKDLAIILVCIGIILTLTGICLIMGAPETILIEGALSLAVGVIIVADTI